MNPKPKHIKENFGNLLLISGNGRNVGKTFFACRIIENLSKKHAVIALKISPHIHELPENADILFQNTDFTVINETEITHKDSSLFLQSGAEKVLFVMVQPENLGTAFQQIKSLLLEGPVVCESAGLHDWIAPGLFFFVKKPNETVVKNASAAEIAVMIENDGENLSFDVSRIDIRNNQFYLND